MFAGPLKRFENYVPRINHGFIGDIAICPAPLDIPKNRTMLTLTGVGVNAVTVFRRRKTRETVVMEDKSAVDTPMPALFLPTPITA